MWTSLELRPGHFLSLVSSFIESGTTFVESIQAGANDPRPPYLPEDGL